MGHRRSYKYKSTGDHPEVNLVNGRLVVRDPQTTREVLFTELCAQYGVLNSTVASRLRSGMTLETALGTPVIKKKRGVRTSLRAEPTETLFVVRIQGTKANVEFCSRLLRSFPVQVAAASVVAKVTVKEL